MQHIVLIHMLRINYQKIEFRDAYALMLLSVCPDANMRISLCE